MAFEVHLPQFIGLLALETLHGGVFFRFERIDAAMTVQNGRDGAGRGRRGASVAQQALSNLAPSPCRMCVADLQYRPLDFFGDFSGCAVGAAGTIPLPTRFLCARPVQPLVTGLAADAVPPAQGADVGAFLLCEAYKFFSE